MSGMRALRVAAIVALAVSLTACGGLGVNLRSGGSGANNPNQVAITATSGTTLNPYPLLDGHTVTLVAHPSSGNVINYGVAQPVRWDSSNPTAIVLLEPDCVPTHAYGGEYSTTICVFAMTTGKVTANVDGTTSNGAVGTLGIAATN
jgi:hypothetical protein